MKKFLKMFFPYDGIYEVLLGTNGVKPNLKPIGIIRSDVNTITLKIYKNTLTYSNLIINNKCSINIVTNPEVFLSSLIQDLNFTIDDEYGLPVLRSYNVIYAECKKIDDSKDPAVFELLPFDLEINSMTISPAYSRGYGILIDFLVNYTRVDIYGGKDLEKLLEILSYEYGVIKKTTPHLAKMLGVIQNTMRSKGYKLD
ncbi:hypothetical protein BFU36_02445 [Sulfolobus sp. A20]|uniref:DUF447 domain-containing protein n=1 Tax=Saccharolobus sp. A20 TaxID=1891280 RepID=UPI000846097F|nr:DUF447 domain-containing protein [Sulfolobus sp. A20]TRM74137.1 DUF447 domain-containing protein [Sulfolobus sp. E5]TRM83115.1 DUF447 domain-containing protein [Sulfolobus sp. A20-N-F6]TRM85590.1 DUF447 domain-containing protein [Sulfolobus sp. F3]TRM87222.1 DUF447 domain-containing protein [Sulfolobus sp. C3]TRM94835.1 DUF447 domain-containing protein [Sulfolobus sp. A20-N-G8]TRN01752.1 DUF447 domain-containing protein [Sulfolobus sp. E1]TRN02496.1 DUF447 domain-containing protein [Sulfo